MQGKGSLHSGIPVVGIAAGKLPELASCLSVGRVFLFQARQKLVADTVAQKAHVCIGGIFPPADVPFLKQLAQAAPGEHEQGAQQVPLVIPGAHAAQGRPAGAPNEAHELIFAKVFPLVPCQYPLAVCAAAYLFQQGIAGRAGGILRAALLLAGQCGNIGVHTMAGQGKPGAQVLHKAHIICRICPQAMVDGAGRQLPASAWGQQGKENGQRRGIGAAGKGQQQMLTVLGRAQLAAEAFHRKAGAGRGRGKVCKLVRQHAIAAGSGAE